MTVVAGIAVKTKTATAGPTATEIDRWAPNTFTGGRITLENLDISQTLNGWVETRPVAGTGTFGKIGETTWGSIAPGIAQPGALPNITGDGEARFMVKASGVGLTCRYTRRNVSSYST